MPENNESQKIFDLKKERLKRAIKIIERLNKQKKSESEKQVERAVENMVKIMLIALPQITRGINKAVERFNNELEKIISAQEKIKE